MQILSIPTKKRIYAIAFSPDGCEMTAVSGDGYMRVWDLTTGEVRQWITVEETSSGYDIAYLDQNRVLFTGTQLRWWDIAANGWHVIEPRMRLGLQLCLSPDGKLLAEVDKTNSTDWGGGGLFIRETDTWTILPGMEDERFTTGGVAFSADGKYLATGHIVRVGEKRRSFAYVPGTYAINDYDYIVHMREMATGKIVQSSSGWQQGVGTLAFSLDGKFLAGGAGPRLRIWDIENNREVALHKRGSKHFQGLAFNADGRYLSSVSNDETVRIWETRSWQEHTTFTWQIGKLLNIAFAPDGLRAAAGSDRGKIVIWDVEE